jgi:hypothetical protein
MSRFSGSGSGSDDGLGVLEEVEEVSVLLDEVVVGWLNSYTSKRMALLAAFPPQASKLFPGQGRSQTPLAASVPEPASRDGAQ